MGLHKVEAVRVGPAGWSYEDWKGIVYPPAMPARVHPLTYLCQFFDTVEINTTFYRPVNPRHSTSWVQRVSGNANFRFTAKLWQRFTHERDTWPSGDEIQQVREGLAPLCDSGKLGALLIQFPWSFKRTVENRPWLARVLEEFSQYPLALEIRHASWNRPEVFDGLRERRVAFCNIDQPLFSGSLKPTAEVTSRVGYVRLHGRNADDWFREDAGRDERYDYLYTPEELKAWIEKIERIRALADEVYVITNNHYRGQAVVNAFELRDALGQPAAVVPDSLVERYPQLRKLSTKSA
ncbi:MAG: DUF72 domain-containing protein [Candidatus Hydrogenedentes bacterium]|nr:DUF72 domain-containing protein [Candidatus Hydrogenedentota bacterium]